MKLNNQKFNLSYIYKVYYEKQREKDEFIHIIYFLDLKISSQLKYDLIIETIS